MYILEGEVMLIEDDSETVLKPGDAAGFKANLPNGHHLVNKSGRDAIFLKSAHARNTSAPSILIWTW